MRPPSALTLVLWTLAIASVGAYAWLKLARPDAAAGHGGVEIVLPDAPATPEGELPVHFATPPFALTDQHGQPFSSDELKGKVWVGFIFLVNCPTGACPQMVGKMAKLQAALPDERVHFVSFTVDPERDTPEAMLAYAQKVGETEVTPRWHLLTGRTAGEMKALAERMKLSVSDGFEHSTFFLLVDAAGNVRGAYGNTDPDGMARLAADAEKLLARGGA